MRGVKLGSGMLIVVTEPQLGNLVKHTFKDVSLKIVLFTSQIWAIKFAEESNSQNECTTRRGREWREGPRGWKLGGWRVWNCLEWGGWGNRGAGSGEEWGWRGC